MKSSFWYAGVALAGSAVTALGAPPTPPPGYAPITYTHQFNFDDGLQGWTISGGTQFPAGTARWVNKAVDPNGPNVDGAPSGTSGLLGDAQSGSGGGSLYLPGFDGSGGDESIASITTMQLINVASIANWCMQADVYIPNLSVSNPNFRGYPGNCLIRTGIQAIRTDGKACYVEGGSTSGGTDPYLQFRDQGVSCASWGNSNQLPKIVCPGGTNPINIVRSLEHAASGACLPYNQWWDRWVTLFIDFDMVVRGKVQAWVYIPWDGAVGSCRPDVTCNIGARNAGWFKIFEDTIDAECTALQQRNKFQLGGTFSWTQAQFDNVKFVLPKACSDPFADADDDGDVDHEDFGIWQSCYTGANPPTGAFDANRCACFDRQRDGDVDEDDYGDFKDCASGPSVAANPDCD